jgi:hypothetical protein
VFYIVKNFPFKIFNDFIRNTTTFRSNIEKIKSIKRKLEELKYKLFSFLNSNTSSRDYIIFMWDDGSKYEEVILERFLGVDILNHPNMMKIR